MKFILYIEQVPFGGTQQSSFSDPVDAVTDLVMSNIVSSGKRGINNVLRATSYSRTFDLTGTPTDTVVTQYPQGSDPVTEPVPPVDPNATPAV